MSYIIECARSGRAKCRGKRGGGGGGAFAPDCRSVKDILAVDPPSPPSSPNPLPSPLPPSTPLPWPTLGKCGTKIDKGALRLGSVVQINGSDRSTTYCNLCLTVRHSLWRVDLHRLETRNSHSRLSLSLSPSPSPSPSLSLSLSLSPTLSLVQPLPRRQGATSAA